MNAALLIFPKFPEALTLRGALEKDAGKFAEAISDLQQAIQYDASFAVAYLALASVFNSTGRFAEALPVLTQAERLTPNLWYVQFEIARAKLGMGQFTDALRSVDRAAELAGGPQQEPPAIHLMRAYALIGLGERPRATTELETLLARQPSGRFADDARTLLDKLRASAITASQ